MAFISLNRIFLPWSEDNGNAAELWAIHGSQRDSFTWDTLLEKHRVIILAEAGSGKTEELKAQARVQTAADKFAFYATVQDVARDGLDGALSVADRRRLEQWRAGDRPAWFFIDSIDEAKLDGFRLDTALRKLADGIDAAPARAHVVISGRITDWEFRADRARFGELLPVPANREAPPPPSTDAILAQALRGEFRRKKPEDGEKPLVLLMGVLDEARVRLFAAANGITQLDAFIAGIADGDLWSLARRPLDLQWLVTYWRRFGKFGPLAAMIETSLVERLQEPNPQHARNDPISADRALSALERIGAAMVFGRVDKIAIPDSEITLDPTKPCITLEEVLPDWSPDHRRRLLSRAAFDPATFGYVRLHNDNEGMVRAFLAAKWLATRRQHNCSAANLKDLLFAEPYGIPLIKPSLQETTAWLSIWDSDVAREVTDREPLLLLAAGDPGSLPPNVRADVLNRVVDRIVHSGQRGGLVKDDTLKRFSVTELAPSVRDLWNKHKAVPLVRELLLRIIGLGHLTACADIAEEAVFAGYDDTHTTVYGGRAILAVSNVDTVRRYANHVIANAERLPERALWEALDQLFLHGITIRQLLELLPKMAPDVRDGSLGLRYFGPRFAERIDDAGVLEEFLTGLMAILGESAHDISAEETAEEKSYYPAITTATHRLLVQSPPTAAPPIAIAAALRLAEDRRHRVSDDLREILMELRRSPSRRRAAFWQAVEQFEHHPILQGRPLEHPWQMQILGWSSGFEREDLTWVLADAQDNMLCVSEERKRLIANAAMDIWGQNDKDPALLDRIRGVTEHDATMAAAVTVWLAPKTPQPWEEEHEKRRANIDAERDRQEKERKDSWDAFLEPLRKDPDQLRHVPPPTRENVDGRLFHLWELLSSMDEHQSRYAIDNINLLEPILGRELTLALRDGLIAFWRHWEPTLETARPADRRNQVSRVDCMAIACISIDARTNPQWVEQLTSAEAGRAAAFATLELNGFPPWMLPLARRWPQEVSAVLAGEITVEIDDPTPGLFRGTLQDVVYAPFEIAALVAPRLLAVVEARPGLSGVPLASVLTILCRGTPAASVELTKLVVDRGAAATDLEIAAYYLGAAFQRDADAAVAALSAKLDTLSPLDQRFLVERLLPRLFGDRVVEPDLKTPVLPLRVMERLVTVAFRTVRFEDDNRHEEGVSYTPDGRDAAERARGALFNLLIATPGRATVETLDRFKSASDMPIQVNRLDELIFDRAAQDSEHSPWKPGEAFALEQSFDLAPSTALDLQRATVRRLSDIQHDLHHADFAQGKTFKSLPQEVDVQNWVGNELRNRQGRAYSVEREPHVVEEKEPDIRLRARSTDASLPIEVKVAESWTLAKLEEALVSQLCGRYLRARDANYGLLLLAHQNARAKGWEQPDGTFLDFMGLVSHLQVMADQIAGSDTDAPQAQIVALDVSALH